MDGFPNGTFEPTSALTREQAAAVLARVGRRLGWIPATAAKQYGVQRSVLRPGLADHRVWTSGAGVVPENYLDSIVAKWLPVENQIASSMCVAFASSEIRRWWVEKQTNSAGPMLSAPYIYARGHQIAGDFGEGMQPVWAAEALSKYGVCLWDVDPLNPTNETVPQSISASPASLDAAAAAYKITSYGPVNPADSASMKQAILHAPILIAIPVPLSGGIEQPVPDGHGDFNVLWPPGPNVQTIAGHAIIIWGWRTDASGHLWWRIRNSWGASWAAGGNAWLDSSYPIWEAWSLTCAPQPPQCEGLAGFLKWLETDMALVLQRLEKTWTDAGDSAAVAAQKAKGAYDAQVAALKARMQAEGCTPIGAAPTKPDGFLCTHLTTALAQAEGALSGLFANKAHLLAQYQGQGLTLSAAQLRFWDEIQEQQKYVDDLRQRVATKGCGTQP